MAGQLVRDARVHLRLAAPRGRAVQRREGTVLLVAAAARSRSRASLARALAPCQPRRSSLPARCSSPCTPTSSRAGGTGSSARATGIAASSTCYPLFALGLAAFFAWSATVRRGAASPRRVLTLLCALSVFQMLQVLARRAADVSDTTWAAVPRALPAGLQVTGRRRLGIVAIACALALGGARCGTCAIRRGSLTADDGPARSGQRRRDGTRYRWSGGHASFFVPVGCAARSRIPVATTFDARAARLDAMMVTFTIDDAARTRVCCRIHQWRR